MKYFTVVLILIVFFTVNTTYASSPPIIDFEFVGLNDTYQLVEEFTIKFEKTTQQPCPSYEISIMKDGHPESKITHGHEPLCAIPGPIDPYLFNAEYSKPELFDSAGTYHIEVQMDETKILKKIEILDKTFSIIQKQVKYVIPYQITGGTINNMKLNCDLASFVVSISTSDAGTLRLDIPHRMLGGIFMVLVDEVEWDEVSLDGNTLTVNFPENTNMIKVLGAYDITPDKYTGVCDVSHDPPYSYILSPLKQYNLGIRYPDIICKDGLELIGKSTNGTPACVKPQSVEKLVQRWWATTDRTYDLVNPHTYSITKNEKTFQIQYSLEGAKLSEIVHDDDANSIHVILDDTIGGSLVISIPRDLIDAVFSNEYDDFFVLINGQEFDYGEQSTENERTLTILLPRDARDIEIIAPYLI